MPKCAEQSTRHGARWNVHDRYCSSVQCFTCSHIKPSSKVPVNWKCWWTSLIWSPKSYRSQNWPPWRDNPFEISVHVTSRSCAANLNIVLLVRTAYEFKTNGGFPFRRTQKINAVNENTFEQKILCWEWKWAIPYGVLQEQDWSLLHQNFAYREQFECQWSRMPNLKWIRTL